MHKALQLIDLPHPAMKWAGPGTRRANTGRGRGDEDDPITGDTPRGLPGPVDAGRGDAPLP
jgi:hypothetical protein